MRHKKKIVAAVILLIFLIPALLIIDKKIRFNLLFANKYGAYYFFSFDSAGETQAQNDISTVGIPRFCRRRIQ